MIRVLSKGYLPISLLPPSKLEKILKEVRIAIAKSNKDYDLVLTRLFLYYDMKLIMYQIETVPVPILDENEQVHSYTELKIEKPLYCIK